jgi:putative drug exporter of the RND superfamily
LATLLYRLGRFAYRKKWMVIATWLVVLIGVAGADKAFSAPLSDNFTIPGIEAQQAMDTVDAKFAGASAGTGELVFQAPGGQKVTARAYEQAITLATSEAAKAPGVQDAVSPFSAKTISPDESTAYTEIVLDGASSDQVGAATANALQAVSAQAQKSGLRVALGGDAFSSGSSSGGGPATEALGLLAALIVLALAFRSLRTALLPVATALVSVGVGTLGLLALSGVFSMNSTAPALGAMLGLAVGIDYALFIVSRHQSQVRGGMDPMESAGRAVATSGSAVVFAGASVVIALAALAVVDIPFLTVMGIGAAETVVVAVLVSVTLLPALLGLRGRRIVESRVFRARPVGAAAAEPKRTMGARWVGLVTRFRWPAVAATVLALVFLAAPVSKMQLGLSQDLQGSSAQAAAMIGSGFGPGVNGPLLLLVFRSVAVPLKAMLGFVLSAGASLGATVAAFQWGWLAAFFGVDRTGQLLSLLPIMLLGILFGLAMDYEVFLVSRMREEHTHGHPAQKCLHTGFRHGARVVTAAALIMISVFSSFAFSNQQMIKPMAFAFAVGILCDAFVVRMTLVPAVMSLLGRSAWWLPGWLDRLLPRVDIEGAKLGQTLAEDEDELGHGSGGVAEPVPATTAVLIPHQAEEPVLAGR